MVFNYNYNPANQRSGVTNADGSRWIYSYDSLGQVTSGKKYFSDGTPAAGQQFDYSFDDIGNRKYAGEGGNEFGTGLRYQNYTVNNLNQYTQRTVPGAADVLGTANSNATVTLNTAPTYRHSDYFRAEPKLDNKTSPIFTNLSTIGVLPNGTNKDIVTTNSGNLLLPKNPEALVYDLRDNASCRPFGLNAVRRLCP
jgi:YD repeat-containing protein